MAILETLTASTPPGRRLPRSRPARLARQGPLPEAYGSQAWRYDQRTAAFRHWRELLVGQLPVQPGDTVLDVGCGTGLCMALLQEKIGSAGTIVGIDESEQMLEVARNRVTERGWGNVRLIAVPADRAPIDGAADAALFCAVHDVMQSRAALEHVFAHLRPGAPVGAVGGKWPSAWLWPLRAWVADLHAPFVADFTGFDRPWGLLAEFVPGLRVQELALGAGYLALGRAPGC
jgi:ubiquinone/menaquinone biosynthesis C-methylase UbiE